MDFVKKLCDLSGLYFKYFSITLVFSQFLTWKLSRVGRSGLVYQARGPLSGALVQHAGVHLGEVLVG